MATSTAIRLDKLLSNLGYCSRKEAKRFLRDYAVLEGETPITRPDARVNPDILTIAGEPLDPRAPLVIALHKPVGVVCTASISEGETVYDLLPERFGRRNPPLVCIGRLDKESSGLLLLSDDGALVHRLTSPRHTVEKEYRVILDRPLRGDEETLFASGTLMLQGETKPLLPAKFSSEGECQATVIVTEGRYHQVRRMFAALGNHVVELARVRIGGIKVEEIEEGEYRLIESGRLA